MEMYWLREITCSMIRLQTPTFTKLYFVTTFLTYHPDSSIYIAQLAVRWTHHVFFCLYTYALVFLGKRFPPLILHHAFHCPTLWSLHLHSQVEFIFHSFGSRMCSAHLSVMLLFKHLSELIYLVVCFQVSKFLEI